jgi:predicted amidohydrolase
VIVKEVLSMDPADAFVKAYDLLLAINADTLSDWSVTESVQANARRVQAEVQDTGQLPETWMPSTLRATPTLFSVLLGLDLALLQASREGGWLGVRTLDYLQVRFEMNGRLNEETTGILLFKRSSCLRPNDDAERLDDFLHLLRLPPQHSANTHVVPVSELYDLPDVERMYEAGELAPLPPLVIAQLPFLAGASDLRWAIVDEPHGNFYNVAPNSERLGKYLHQALDTLDHSGAVLALLPEASLDDDLVEKWCELLKRTARPEESALTWLLIGTGPVRKVGPALSGRRRPNRAVLVHRSGNRHPLLTQDKHSGFCFTSEKQKEYGVDRHLGGVKRDEWIPHDRSLTVLESRRGRFGVQICEDFGRPDRRQHITAAGVTHLIVPVLAAAMWEDGWQARAGEALGIDVGTKAAVSNSLAIERFYKNDPVPTLLTVVGPSDKPEQYLTGRAMIRCYSNQDGKDVSAREDALQPRVAEW